MADKKQSIVTGLFAIGLIIAALVGGASSQSEKTIVNSVICESTNKAYIDPVRISSDEKTIYTNYTINGTTGELIYQENITCPEMWESLQTFANEHYGIRLALLKQRNKNE